MSLLTKHGPREFFELLRSHPEMNSYAVTAEQTSRALDELCKKDPRFRQLEGLDLTKFGQELLDAELTTLINRFTGDQRKALLSAVAIGSLRLKDANAFAGMPEHFRFLLGDAVADYGGFVIVVHDGLISLLSSVANILYASLTVVKTRQVCLPSSDPEAVTMPNSLSLEEGATLLRSVVEKSLGHTPRDNLSVPVNKDERWVIAGKHVIAAKRFVIAHELSHILLGHVGNDNERFNVRAFPLPSFSGPTAHTSLRPTTTQRALSLTRRWNMKTTLAWPLSWQELNSQCLSSKCANLLADSRQQLPTRQ